MIEMGPTWCVLGPHGAYILVEEEDNLLSCMVRSPEGGQLQGWLIWGLNDVIKDPSSIPLCSPQSVGFCLQDGFLIVTQWLLQFLLTQQHPELLETLPLPRLFLKADYLQTPPRRCLLAKSVLVHLSHWA